LLDIEFLDFDVKQFLDFDIKFALLEQYVDVRMSTDHMYV